MADTLLGIYAGGCRTQYHFDSVWRQSRCCNELVKEPFPRTGYNFYSVSHLEK